VFVPGKPFQPSLMFERPGEAPFSVPALSLQTLSADNRIDYKHVPKRRHCVFTTLLFLRNLQMGPIS
jgi:hypothetical protein